MYGPGRTESGYCCPKFEQNPKHKATVTLTELMQLSTSGAYVEMAACTADAKVAALDMHNMARDRSH
jgi:hypothetical protein|eukprot:COSAG02_NODE_3662_length_6405_cov_62.673327_4_plen_67_part_00